MILFIKFDSILPSAGVQLRTIIIISANLTWDIVLVKITFQTRFHTDHTEVTFGKTHI